MRIATEVKPLMGALRGPHKRARAPKDPQLALKRPKIVKKDYKNKKN